MNQDQGGEWGCKKILLILMENASYYSHFVYICQYILAYIINFHNIYIFLSMKKELKYLHAIRAMFQKVSFKNKIYFLAV